MGSKKKAKKVAKKTAKKKAAGLPKGKSILFLHVNTGNKTFFNSVTKKIDTKEIGRVTQSKVADRILGNLKKYPKLLQAALQ